MRVTRRDATNKNQYSKLHCRIKVRKMPPKSELRDEVLLHSKFEDKTLMRLN